MLFTLQTGRFPRIRCSLVEPSLVSSRQYGRRTRSRVPYGFKNLTSQMRTLRHSLIVSDGRICVCCPIGTGRQGLHHMHRPGPVDGMGGLTQVFCTFSETLTDVANALVDTDLPLPSYGAISEIPSTVPPPPSPPNTNESLTHMYCYIDNVISAVQVGPDIQHRVFGGTVRALKWISHPYRGSPKTQ